MRLGFLGVGEAGRDHAAAASALGHEVAAATALSSHSPRWKTFQETWPQTRWIGDAAALIADPKIDALVVSLPWASQPEWAGQLLAQSKPALIEKPIALEPESLATALKRAGRQAANKIVGLNRRFYQSVRAVAARLEKGGLKSVDISISEDVERLVARRGADMIPHTLANSSCHILDLALHLLGPLQVAHMASYDEPGYSVPFRSFNGLLITRSDLPVALAINGDDPSPVGLRFRFDDHTTWVLAPIEVLTVYRGYDVIERSESCQVRRYQPRAIVTVITDCTHRPGFLEQMQAFTSGDFGPAARPDQAVALLQLIQQIQGMWSGNE